MTISRKQLTTVAIAAELRKYPQWEVIDHCLYREFKFTDFAAAWTFMQAVADAAERLDHHPDWRNVYNKVEIRLSTHDAGGITALDFALAEAIDAY